MDNSHNDDYEARKAAYFARFATLPQHEQQRHLTVALAWLCNVVLGLHPEQIPTIDQDVIDAEFYRIMEGADLDL